MTSIDLGPCNCNGETSGSIIFTSNPEFIATPCAHNKISLSPRENQNLFSANFKRTGSLSSPPSLFVIKTYLH